MMSRAPHTALLATANRVHTVLSFALRICSLFKRGEIFNFTRIENDGDPSQVVRQVEVESRESKEGLVPPLPQLHSVTLSGVTDTRIRSVYSFLPRRPSRARVCGARAVRCFSQPSNPAPSFCAEDGGTEPRLALGAELGAYKAPYTARVPPRGGPVPARGWGRLHETAGSVHRIARQPTFDSAPMLVPILSPHARTRYELITTAV